MPCIRVSLLPTKVGFKFRTLAESGRMFPSWKINDWRPFAPLLPLSFFPSATSESCSPLCFRIYARSSRYSAPSVSRAIFTSSCVCFVNVRRALAGRSGNNPQRISVARTRAIGRLETFTDHYFKRALFSFLFSLSLSLSLSVSFLQ